MDAICPTHGRAPGSPVYLGNPGGKGTYLSAIYCRLCNLQAEVVPVDEPDPVEESEEDSAAEEEE